MFLKTAIYLFWLGLIPSKRKRAVGILKMPPLCVDRITLEILSFPFLCTLKFFSSSDRACALVLPLCRHRGNEIIFEHENIKEMLAVQTIEPLKNLSNHI